jgi:tRNA 2-thiouridine synthesizing protein A
VAQSNSRRCLVAVDKQLDEPFPSLPISRSHVRYIVSPGGQTTPEPGDTWIGIPQSILDAGGDVAAVLAGCLYRHISRLAEGDVLEVISRNSGSRSDVPNWCQRTGNNLLGFTEDDEATVFWIRKAV